MAKKLDELNSIPRCMFCGNKFTPEEADTYNWLDAMLDITPTENLYVCRKCQYKIKKDAEKKKKPGKPVG